MTRWYPQKWFVILLLFLLYEHKKMFEENIRCKILILKKSKNYFAAYCKLEQLLLLQIFHVYVCLLTFRISLVFTENIDK